MAHSHHLHREHQVSHRRVHHILKDEPAGAKQHNHSHAFSKVTSKTAAERHDGKVHGHSAPKRYAKGGRVKGHKGNQTNIAIVMPHRSAPGQPAPVAGPAGGPPGIPAGGPPGAPPAMPPGMPPGMPMRARGGKVRKADGGATFDERYPRGVFSGGKGPSIDAAFSGSDPSKTEFPLGNALRAKAKQMAKASGGKVQKHIDGESTEADIKAWGKRASANSYFRGGAATGVGREEKAAHMKRKGR